MMTSAQLRTIVLRSGLCIVAMLGVLPMPILMPTAQAQTFTVLHNFTGQTDGEYPYAPVTLDSTGTIYGQTVSSYEGTHAGTVYTLAHRRFGWTFVPLSDGGGWGGVTIGPNGSLYGSGHVAYDTIGVFNVQPPSHPSPNPLAPWIQTSLSSLEVAGYQTSGVVFDRAGNIYGTTSEEGRYDGGTVYELSPSDGGWTKTVLYNFGNGTDGQLPFDNLVVDAAGNLYGTTEMGGEDGFGTVFELSYSPGSGWTESFVYSFTGGADGAYPYGGLIFDSAGNLYGASAGTDSPGVAGTVFKLTPSGGTWTFSTIYSFGNGQGGQCGPRGTPAMDGAGNLYDTTACLGAHSIGSVFKLTAVEGGWSFTSLHDFTGGNDGGYPNAGVTLDANGNIYGTTVEGGQGGDCGSSGCGVVWEITP